MCARCDSSGISFAVQMRHSSSSVAAALAQPETLDVQPAGNRVDDDLGPVDDQRRQTGTDLRADLRGHERQRLIPGVVPVNPVVLGVRRSTSRSDSTCTSGRLRSSLARSGMGEWAGQGSDTIHPCVVGAVVTPCIASRPQP
jgi:hypothetical protein